MPSSSPTGSTPSAGETVRLKLINPLRPGLITSPDDDSFWYLIMPIRLAG